MSNQRCAVSNDVVVQAEATLATLQQRVQQASASAAEESAGELSVEAVFAEEAVAALVRGVDRSGLTAAAALLLSHGERRALASTARVAVHEEARDPAAVAAAVAAGGTLQDHTALLIGLMAASSLPTAQVRVLTSHAACTEYRLCSKGASLAAHEYRSELELLLLWRWWRSG